MRYRKLDANSDMQFGHSSADFWYNQPEAVGQSVKTRLLLFAGEWFLDTSTGTPWGGFPLNPQVVAQGKILAEHTQLSRDMALKERVIMTQGVYGIANYGSSFDGSTRRFSVNMTVDTIYGSQLEFTIAPAIAAAQPNIQFRVLPVLPRRPTSPLIARGNRQWRAR